LRHGFRDISSIFPVITEITAVVPLHECCGTDELYRRVEGAGHGKIGMAHGSIADVGRIGFPESSECNNFEM